VFQSTRRSEASARRVAMAAVALLFTGAVSQAATTSVNTGSLGAAANGTDADGVTFGPGAIAAGSDQAAVYNNTAGVRTSVPFQAGLNPVATTPFTIEFWARPVAVDGDDSPVSNRDAVSANRSGWAFFQRPAVEGWNLRTYNGTGSTVGWDLTGGTAPLNAWSHVVATWNGSAARLYVNGVLADDTNAPGAPGGYVANPGTTTTPSFLVGATDTASPFNGSVDEVAFYGSVLSDAQIANHFATASSVTPGAYYSLIQADGARLQLSNVPEPTSAALVCAAGAMLFGRRRRA
jgi:hypothetical protein